MKVVKEAIEKVPSDEIKQFTLMYLKTVTQAPEFDFTVSFFDESDSQLIKDVLDSTGGHELYDLFDLSN